MVNGRPGPAPRLLPAVVTEEQLRTAVADNRSWRGVLRALDLKSSSFGPKLRNACNELEIDYSHFGSILATDHQLREVIASSRDWPTALARLGYSKGSGTARATVRKHCARLGVDTAHLDAPLKVGGTLADELAPKRRHLRDAGPFLALFAFSAAGMWATPAPEGAPYDILVDAGPDGVKRVQVKTGTSRLRGTWVCRLSRSEYDKNGYGGHRQAVYSAEDIDYFACVDGDFQLYMIPVKVVEGLASICLRKYERYRVNGLYDSRLW